MTKCWLGLVAVLISTGICTNSQAAEPYQSFLEGLRERGYHDTAQNYLELLSKRNDLPAEIADTLEFEQAKTLLAQALTTRSPRLQEELLDRAETLFKQFITSHSDSAIAADANQELAHIMLERARMQIAQALSPTHKQEQATLREQARKNVQDARIVFQKAHDLYKKQWESFGAGFIEDEEKRAARKVKESRYLKTQLDLAVCSYEEGQTYPPGSDEFKKQLTKASREFSQIHEKYRSMGIGLHARMMQGKCFEEQNEIGKALGIYNELLDHTIEYPNLKALQNKVSLFELICLNHEQRKDYQLVTQKADAWLKTSDSKGTSLTGLGIRWQKLIALEHLAKQADRADDDKKKYQREALTIARFIQQYPGPFKDRARAKIAELELALGEASQEPQSFAAAFSRGNDLVRDVNKTHEKLSSLKSGAERTQLEQEMQSQGREAIVFLKQALDLVDRKTSLRDVNKARFSLALVYYLTGQNYDAIVIGDFLAHKFARTDSETAQDAAFLVMASAFNLYREADRTNRSAEIRLMKSIGQHLVTTWPSSTRADEARLTLGQVLRSANLPEEAATWYQSVSSSSRRYAEAQLSAGQAQWVAIARSVTKDSISETNKPPSAETLKTKTAAAEKQIRTGIELLQANAKDDSNNDLLIVGKVSLAELLSYQGKYQEAIEQLTGQPQSVIDFVGNIETNSQVTSGPRSVEFAGQCYQLLLRCYVGTQQIDLALAAMEQMEKLLGSQSSASMTTVYIQLGQSIQKEIEQLVEANDRQQLKTVQQSFEKFLNGLYERQQNMSYNALLWMATTYASLGEGLFKSSPETARNYFSKSADIYQRVASHKDFPAQSRTAIDLRIAYSLRRQGNYTDALALLSSILETKSNLIDAQFEAAQTAQDWGLAENSQQLLFAIQGNTKAQPPGPVWGWASIGTRLQRMMLDGKIPVDQLDDYKERFQQARYNMSYCHLQFALSQSSNQRTAALESVQQEVESFALLNPETDDTWKKQFSSLHQDILKQLGKPSAQLDWSVAAPISTKLPDKPTSLNQSASSITASTEPAALTPQSQQPTQKAGSSTFNLILFAGSVGVGLLFAVGIWFMMNKQQKQNRRRPSYGETSMPSFAAASGEPKRRTGKRRPAPEQGKSPTPQRRRRQPPPE